MIEAADQYLRIAKVAGAHGLNGRLKLTVITDLLDRFNPGNTIYLKIGENYRPYKSIAFTETAKNILIKLEKVDDRDAAESLQGVEVYITREEAEKTRDILEKDDFYYYELVGCRVFKDGNLFGNVVDIMEAGENKVLVLHDEKRKEFLIPFNQSMVDTKHIADGRIDINPIEGLFDID